MSAGVTTILMQSRCEVRLKADLYPGPAKSRQWVRIALGPSPKVTSRSRTPASSGRSGSARLHTTVPASAPTGRRLDRPGGRPPAPTRMRPRVGGIVLEHLACGTFGEIPVAGFTRGAGDRFEGKQPLAHSSGPSPRDLSHRVLQRRPSFVALTGAQEELALQLRERRGHQRPAGRCVPELRERGVGFVAAAAYLPAAISASPASTCPVARISGARCAASTFAAASASSAVRARAETPATRAC